MRTNIMYEFKGSKQTIRGQRQASEIIGIQQPTLSKIINKKVLCRKVVAFSITKYINPSADIEDYFIKKEK